MTVLELNNVVDAAKEQIKLALQTVYDSMNQG